MKKVFVESMAIFFMLFFSSISHALVSVGEEDVKEAIRKEFFNLGETQEVDLEFFGGKTNFEIQEAKKIKIMVDALDKEEGNSKFKAKIVVFADGEEKYKSVISGKYYFLSEVFVPTRNIAKGDIIKEEDLRIIKIRANRVKPQNVVEKENLVGQEAKKSIKEGRMVQENEIGSVILVHKGDVVNSIYQTGVMQIVAKCEAQEDGGKGDVIEVMNLKSKKIISAKVIDKDNVRVNGQ